MTRLSVKVVMIDLEDDFIEQVEVKNAKTTGSTKSKSIRLSFVFVQALFF
jgi:hypothetical protein